jgi:isoquinoline 1-oxidoreductase beta subunit
MGRARTIARRSFLIGSAAILGGVAFGAYFVTRPTPNPLLDGLAGRGSADPLRQDHARRHHADRAARRCGPGHRLDPGHADRRGVGHRPRTATLDPGQPHQAYFNAVVAAESLPFPAWDHGFVASTVRDLMGQVARLTSSQFTGGSSSTADLHETLRLAGATARETLKAAAAARTGVPSADLRTEDGHVVLPDGTRIPYTELAGEAAAIEPVTDVTLRPASDWTRLGQAVPAARHRREIDRNAGLRHRRGPARHAARHRARQPGRGGAMAGYNADAALAMQGVRSVVEVNEGLAVIADNTWFAFRAAEALEVEWLPPDYPPAAPRCGRR